jgi:hypothetical protein
MKPAIWFHFGLLVVLEIFRESQTVHLPFVPDQLRFPGEVIL